MITLNTTLNEPQYFSVVFYLAMPSKEIGSIIRTCCELSSSLLGPVRPYLRWGLQRNRLGRRSIRYSLDSEELFSGFSKSPDEGLNLLVPAPNSRGKSNEFIWLLDYQPDPISQVHFEPTLGVHFGLPFLTNAQSVRLRSFSELLTESVVENSELGHALADVGAVSMTGRGGLYHSQVPLYVPLDRIIRRYAWLRLGEQRKRKLRGVFWGQVLSVWMVEQLGGPDRFLEEYRLLEDPVNTDLARTFPDGSMFVCLSNSPLDVRPPNPFSTPPVIGPLPPMIDRAVWLHERFTEAGLL